MKPKLQDLLNEVLKSADPRQTFLLSEQIRKAASEAEKPKHHAPAVPREPRKT